MSRSPARVLHVYKDVHPEVPGGVERHVTALTAGVRGYESAVLIARRGVRPTRDRVVAGNREVAVWQAGRALSTPLTTGYFRWVRRLRPDVVHLHMPNPVAELAALTLPAHVPLVVTYHADIVRQAAALPLYGPLIERVLRRADAVLVSTESLRAKSPFLASRRESVRVIPFCVDADRFAPPPGGRDGGGRPTIIATGRLVYYKGFERLISLAPRLDADLQIVGTGPLEEQLREQAQSHPNVTIVGGVSDAELVHRLQAADLFVLASTSRAESFGIATLEAQATGLPAVVTDVGTGTIEAIADGATGLAVPSDDDEALVGALRALVDDPARRLAMGEASRRRAVERFSVDAMARAHEALYAELLQRPRRSSSRA